MDNRFAIMQQESGENQTDPVRQPQTPVVQIDDQKNRSGSRRGEGVAALIDIPRTSLPHARPIIWINPSVFLRVVSS